MHKLTTDDLRFVVTRIPKDVRSMMKDTLLFLGGGFIRELISGGKINDIDLHGPDKDMMRIVAKALCDKRQGRWFETANALTVIAANRAPVQFVTRWLYRTPEANLESFDFTVCQCIVWWDRDLEKWDSCISDRFYADLAAKRLVYTFPIREEDAGGSMMRVRKFLSRGYNIQADSLAGVMSRIFDKVDVKRAAGAGLTTTRIIASLLREVDPLTMIDGLEAIDEHEPVDGIADA